MQPAQHAHFLRSNKSRSSDGTDSGVLNINKDRDESPSTTVVDTARNSPFSTSTSFSSHTLFTTPSSLPSPASSYPDLPSSPPTQSDPDVNTLDIVSPAQFPSMSDVDVTPSSQLDSLFAVDSTQAQTQALNPTIDYLAARISWPIGVPRSMLGVFRAQPFASSSSYAAASAGAEEEAKHVFRAVSSRSVANSDVVPVAGVDVDVEDVGVGEGEGDGEARKERRYYNLRRGRGRPPVSTKNPGLTNKRPRSLSPSPPSRLLSSQPSTSPELSTSMSLRRKSTTGTTTSGRVKRRRKDEALRSERVMDMDMEGEMETQFVSRGPLKMFSGSFQADVSGMEGRETEESGMNVVVGAGMGDEGEVGSVPVSEEDEKGEVGVEAMIPTRMEMLGHEHNPSLSRLPFSSSSSSSSSRAFPPGSHRGPFAPNPESTSFPPPPPPAPPYAVQFSPYHSAPFAYGAFVPYGVSTSYYGHGHGHFMHHAHFAPFPQAVDQVSSVSQTNNLNLNSNFDPGPSTSYHPSLPYFHSNSTQSSSESLSAHAHYNMPVETEHAFYGFLPSLDLDLQLPGLPEHLSPAPLAGLSLLPPNSHGKEHGASESQPRGLDGRFRSVYKAQAISGDGTALVEGGGSRENGSMHPWTSETQISGSSFENHGEGARPSSSSPASGSPHLSYPHPHPSHLSIPRARARAQSGSHTRSWSRPKPSTVPSTPSSDQHQPQKQPRARRRTCSSGSSGEPKIYECPRPGCERRFELNNGLALHMKSHVRVEEKERERRVREARERREREEREKMVLEAREEAALRTTVMMEAKEKDTMEAKEEGETRQGEGEREMEEKEPVLEGGNSAMEVEPVSVLGVSMRGASAESRKDTDVAPKGSDLPVEIIGGHGFDSLEDFESVSMSMDMDADAGSHAIPRKVFEGFGLTVDTGGVSGYSTTTMAGPASASLTSRLPSSTSEYFGANVPSSATTATSIGSESFDWTHSRSLPGSGKMSEMGMGMEMEMDDRDDDFASSFRFDCEGLDLSQLVGPSLLMPEALEAEFEAFVAQGQDQAQDQGRKGPSLGALDVMEATDATDAMESTDAMDAMGASGPFGVVQNRTHSLFSVSEDVCARLRAEEAITEHANAEVRMYAARARALRPEPLDPVSCTLFQPLSQHQLEHLHLGRGSDRRSLHAQGTMMAVSGSQSGAGYGGGGERMMMGRGASASGVQERMMLGSEYGHGYPYPPAQSHRDVGVMNTSSGRRSGAGAGGSARRGHGQIGGDAAASGRNRGDQTRKPLAPRLDVPVSRARVPPSSYANGVQGFLDPLEGLGGLGVFF